MWVLGIWTSLPWLWWFGYRQKPIFANDPGSFDLGYFEL